MNEELKPCPFCGSKNVAYNDNDIALYGLDCPGVECNDCDTRNFAGTKEEAIKKWNLRTAGA